MGSYYEKINLAKQKTEELNNYLNELFKDDISNSKGISAVNDIISNLISTMQKNIPHLNYFVKDGKEGNLRKDDCSGKLYIDFGGGIRSNNLEDDSPLEIHYYKTGCLTKSWLYGKVINNGGNYYFNCYTQEMQFLLNEGMLVRKILII